MKNAITKRLVFVLAALAVAFPAHSALAQKDVRHYGLIFGTAYGPDDNPLHGVRVVIHPAGQKKPSWELISDHRGEFAQRVPPGPGDYVVAGQAEVAIVDPDSHRSKTKRLKGEAKVHIDFEERQDVSLHLIK